MQRRKFITLLASGAAAAWPRAAHAGERLPVVALVFGATPLAEMAGPEPVSPLVRAFLLGLRDHGWIEGKNIVIERRTAEGDPNRAPAIFAELVARGVDVIAFSGTNWAVTAARQATQTIPLVAGFNMQPVANGFVTSLARPGGNLTGLTYEAGGKMTAICLQLLKEIAPGIARVAYFGTHDMWKTGETATAAADGRISVVVFIDRPDQYEEAFATLARERPDALYVGDGPVNFVHVARIVAFAAEHRLPAVYNVREAVDKGGLMSYGSNVNDVFRQLAGIVDKVLKGAKPADIPVEQPTRFELIINLKTATALGLTIPPLLRARADEIIE